MQIYPRRTHLFDTDRLYLNNLPKESAYQHGISKQLVQPKAICHLLSLPQESLTHVTSFLDFISLFALGKTSRALREHIDDDNTWRSAFLRQFLGLDAICGTLSDSSLSSLLRRTEGTWRKEFVLRCNLLRRWERSRNGAVTHCPHYSPIATMHLLEERAHGPALLSASLDHGIVARSLPLTGKVLKGNLSAQDGGGIGLGNPNVEFVPNTSACAIESEGWNARIVWGFTNGEVALVTVSRVLEAGRNSMNVTRCRVVDQHRGRVTSTCWNDGAFLTAADDGEVRVWHPKLVQCLWLLKDPDHVILDSCVYVAANLESGIVIATKQSGRTLIWTDIVVDIAASGGTGTTDSTIALPRLIIPTLSKDKAYAGASVSRPAKLYLNRIVSKSDISLGLHYAGDTHFYRVDVDTTSGDYKAVKFIDGPLGSIRTLYAFTDTFNASEQKQHTTMILAGDTLGRVSMFNWEAKPVETSDGVSSFRRIDACPDIAGGVTAISCSEHVLVIGTARGSTQVYDILTSRLLREFSTPVPRFGPHDAGEEQDSHAVKQIILEKDMLILAVGERILAWKAGPVNSHKGKTKRTTPKSRAAKWHKRMEIAQDIDESQRAAADVQAQTQRVYARQRAQMASLEGLGLSEREAVEYILMLSRDEEEARREQYIATAGTFEQEGVFEADLEDLSLSLGNHSPSPASSSQVSPRSSPLFGPMSSDVKVQVTPPFRPEPMEAGFSTSPLGLGGRGGSRARVQPALDSDAHFPVLSSSVSSAGGSPSPGDSPSVSVAGSWSRRLNVSASSSDAATRSGMAQSSNAIRRSISSPVTPSGHSLLSASLQAHAHGTDSLPVAAGAGRMVEEELDSDLRLAIELSLAEELSRREMNK